MNRHIQITWDQYQLLMLIYVVSYIYFYMPDMVACRHILFYVHDSDRMMRIILDLSQAYLYVDSVRDDRRIGRARATDELQSISNRCIKRYRILLDKRR